MDKDIGVGLIIGLLVATTIYVYNSIRFNKAQKIILYICIIFPPAQWVLILVFLLYDYLKNQNSPEVKTQKENVKQTQSIADKLETLKELHEQGILSDNEYYEKSAKLKTEKLQIELKQTDEYKKLKSLYDDGILTKDELKSKIEKIKLKKEKTKVENKNSHHIEQYDPSKLSHTKLKDVLPIIILIMVIVIILLVNTILG
jgi:hypothetical protein